MMRPAARAVFILLAVALNALPWLQQASPRGAFLIAAPATAPPSGVASFREDVINPESPHPMSHVGSITELPDGTLAATWYAGSREGASDVGIYMSTKTPDSETWSPPRAIVTRETAQRDLNRPIKKVGNAVVFAGPDGRLWLVYVTVSVGGWSGSSLNVTLSSDRGRTWTPSRRLTVSPFFNLAELVKNTPVPLEGGGWAVPMHHEFVARFAEVLWLHEQDGEIRAAKTRITGGRSHFQPALVPLDQSRAVAILRDWSEARVVSVSRTGDGGQTWSAPEPADLPNPDAGVDAIRLEDGRLLLAFNDSLTGRGDLSLALSSDEGHTWQRVATLEEEPEPAGDFSYPSLLLSRTGDVHLVYTWKRTAIKHAVFNTAWLDERRSQQPR